MIKRDKFGRFAKKTKAATKKAAPKKKVVSKPKKETPKYLKLSELKNGMGVRGMLRNRKAEGVICIDGNDYYFCQNLEDGADASDKGPYKYSWHFDSLAYDWDVYQLVADPSLDVNLVTPPKLLGYQGKINKIKRVVTFGCKTISFDDVLAFNRILTELGIAYGKTIFNDTTNTNNFINAVTEISKQIK